jgi:hypothetical protein
MARIISIRANQELVQYIEKLHSSWNIDLKEDVKNLPIIYQIYSYGIPFSIESLMFSDLKSKFGSQDTIVQLISEMILIQNNHLSESYYMEDEINAKYFNFCGRISLIILRTGIIDGILG